jgi:hypothetical protein
LWNQSGLPRHNKSLRSRSMQFADAADAYRIQDIWIIRFFWLESRACCICRVSWESWAKEIGKDYQIYQMTITSLNFRV